MKEKKLKLTIPKRSKSTKKEGNEATIEEKRRERNRVYEAVCGCIDAEAKS
jgi:hypothetical protein